MNNLLIYPFNYKNRELLQFCEHLKGYSLTAAVIPYKISGIEKYIQPDKEVFITDNYYDELERCDSVLFLDCMDNNYSLYAERINSALQLNKEVLVVKAVIQRLKDMIGDTVLDKVKIVGGGENCTNIKKNNYLRQINVPVIAILGLGEYCGKFNCEIALRHFFQEKGYSVFQLGSKDYSSLFGFDSMPSDIFEQDIPTVKKSLLFNQYLYQAYKKTDPDIIILGISEGIMQVTHRILNNFGEMAVAVGQAVQIDIGMLGVYYQQELNEQYIKYIEKLRAYNRYKFNCPTDYIFISNTDIEIDETDEEKLNYYHYEAIPPVGHIAMNEDNSIDIFSMEERDSITKVFNRIHNELLSNVAVF